MTAPNPPDRQDDRARRRMDAGQRPRARVGLPVTALAECRSCHAPIRWVTLASGRSMPVDPEPAEGGTVRLEQVAGEIRGVVLTAADRAALDEPTPLYLSHFATCPNAAQHRGRQR